MSYNQDEEQGTPLELSTENLQALNRLNNPTMSNILILGAGELGLCVLEALSKRQNQTQRISVLVRQATLDSAAPEKKKLIQRIRALHVRTEAADVVSASISDLAAIFA